MNQSSSPNKFECESENLYYDSQMNCSNGDIIQNAIYESDPMGNAAKNSIYEAEPIRNAAQNSIYEAEPMGSGAQNSIYETEPIAHSTKNQLYESNKFDNNNIHQMLDNSAYEDPCETIQSMTFGKGKEDDSEEGIDNPLYAEVIKTK